MQTATVNTQAQSRPPVQSPISYSSWISEVIYVPATDISPAYLAIFTHDNGRPSYALLYSDMPAVLDSEGKEVSPAVKLASWVPGLLEAGCGGRSVGKAYNRLVRGKGYSYQRIVDMSKVAELRQMMVQAKKPKLGGLISDIVRYRRLTRDYSPILKANCNISYHADHRRHTDRT